MVDNLIRSFSDDCRLFSQTVEEEVPIEDEEEETEDDVTDDTDVSLLCNLDEPNGDVSNITGINYVTSRLEP